MRGPDQARVEGLAAEGCAAHSRFHLLCTASDSIDTGALTCQLVRAPQTPLRRLPAPQQAWRITSASAFDRLWCTQHGCRMCARRCTMKQASQEPPPRLKTATALGTPGLAGLRASGPSPKMPSAAAMGSSSRRSTFPRAALRHCPGVALSTCTCADCTCHKACHFMHWLARLEACHRGSRMHGLALRRGEGGRDSDNSTRNLRVQVSLCAHLDMPALAPSPR